MNELLANSLRKYGIDPNQLRSWQMPVSEKEVEDMIATNSLDEFAKAIGQLHGTIDRYGKLIKD
jgi:hypothetical protein